MLGMKGLDGLRAAAKGFGARVSSRLKPAPEEPEARSESRLVAAVRGFISLAHAADLYSENEGFFSRAEKDGVKFSRLVRLPAFVALEQSVNRAHATRGDNPHDALPDAVLTDVMEKAERLCKVLTDPRAAILQAPFEHAARKGVAYNGPRTHEAAKGLVETTADYRAMFDIQGIIRKMADDNLHPASSFRTRRAP